MSYGVVHTHKAALDSLLFVTRRPPYPWDNGARIRAHRLAHGLGDAFATTLLTYDHDPASPDGSVSFGELRAALPNLDIEIVRGLGPHKRFAQARSLLSGRSWEFGRYARPEFGVRLRELISERRPAIVHFDDPGVASFAPVQGSLSVFAPHNIEHRIIAGNARSGRGLRSMFAARECTKVEREERRLWRASDLVLAVSKRDALAIRGSGARRIELCPNGTDRVPRLPLPARAAGEPLRLLFIGSGAFRPYEVGLSWFLKEVYAQVAAELPLTFDIVGERPRRRHEMPGVVYHGRVPSVRPFYERAHALVVPVFEGSGTRLKIVEAMAYGRAVISTPLGAEGLPVVAGEHYLVAEDAPGFQRALSELARLLANVGELDAMLARARGAAEPLFWDVIVARLAEIYRSALTLAPRHNHG
jgi:glycosyltransferase involved in cell wall biosynthesis